MDFLKRYDASNGRTIEGVATKSAVGAALTVISCALVLILIMTELSVYWSTATVHHMMVDPQVEELDTVRISLHATFFHLGCEDVQLDLEATRGDTAFGLEENAVAKVPAGEGCSLKGDLVVAKVGGNFHIATGKLSGGSPVIQLMGGMFLGGGGGAFKGANLSHTIHHLSFGEDFPGITSPLEEVTNIIPMDGENEVCRFNPRLLPPLSGSSLCDCPTPPYAADLSRPVPVPHQGGSVHLQAPQGPRGLLELVLH